MPNKTKLSLLAIFLIALSLGSFWYFNQAILEPAPAQPLTPAVSLEQVSTTSSTEKVAEPATEVALARPQEKMAIPHDAEFMISGGSPTSSIRFFEGSIKPLDVHVGDTQDFRIVVASDNGIKKVVAEIETDFGYDYIELKKDRVISILDTYPNPYTVNPKDNTLKILNDTELAQARNDEYKKELARKKSNQANASLGQREVWIGSWLVRNVHDKIYHTNFIAYDSAGNEEKLTMTWSDKCVIPLMGSWSSASTYNGCTIDAGQPVEGVAKGNVTLKGGKDLNLAAGTTFLWNHNYGVIFDQGRLMLAPGKTSQLKQVSHIYMPDQDGDWHVSPTAWNSQTSTALTGYTMRDVLISDKDCLDTNANVRPYNDVYYSTAIPTLTGAAAWDWDCSTTTAGTTTISRSLKAQNTWFPSTSTPVGNFCASGTVTSGTSLSTCNPDGCEKGTEPALYDDPDQQQTRIKESIFSKKYLKLPLSFRFINEAKALDCGSYCEDCGMYLVGCGANKIDVSKNLNNNAVYCGQTLYPAAYFDNGLQGLADCKGDKIGISYLTGDSAVIYCK